MTYGDVFHQNEVEMSRYNFEEADVEQLFSFFDHCEKEALRLVEKDLPLPAYEMVMKASHTFNLLDARHAISVTERQRFILQGPHPGPGGGPGLLRRPGRNSPSRWLTTRCAAKCWSELQRRATSHEYRNPAGGTGHGRAAPQGPQNPGPGLSRRYCPRACKQRELGFGEVQWFASPRRLAVLIAEVQLQAPDKELEVFGPPVERAKDADGQLDPRSQRFRQKAGCRSRAVAKH